MAEAKEELLVMAEKERIDRQKEAILAPPAGRRSRSWSRPVRGARRAGGSTEPSRPMWDTGPIRELARNAAARTVRSVRRRPADRVPTPV